MLVRRTVLTVGLTVVVSLNVLGAGALAAPPGDPSLAGNYVSGAQIVATAMQYLGYPYTTVGNSPSTGFSCIGFVSYVYQANGIPLPDNLWSAQAYAPYVSFDDLEPGDVLFFQNTVWPGLSHPGIYIGNGQFINAEWYNRGVVVSSFVNDPVDGDYWEQHYLGANRPWGGTSAQPAAVAPTSSTVTPEVRAAPTLRSGPRASVDVAGLNVRVRPSINSAIKTVADAGSHVVVLHHYRSWDWVQLANGRFCWVFDAGLTGGTAGEVGRLAVANLPATRVTVAGLRVHARPNLLSPVVTVAYREEKVHLLRSFHNWTRVFLPDGSRGWVIDNYLAGMHSTTPVPTQRIVRRIQATTSVLSSRFDAHLTAGVRIHVRPGLQAAVIGLAAAGTNVQVLKVVGDWVRVRFPRGRTGYVDSLYVQR